MNVRITFCYGAARLHTGSGKMPLNSHILRLANKLTSSVHARIFESRVVPKDKQYIQHY